MPKSSDCANRAQEIEVEFGRRRIVFFVASDGVRTEIASITRASPHAWRTVVEALVCDECECRLDRAPPHRLLRSIRRRGATGGDHQVIALFVGATGVA